jgi:hypothetical protein
MWPIIQLHNYCSITRVRVKNLKSSLFTEDVHKSIGRKVDRKWYSRIAV